MIFPVWLLQLLVGGGLVLCSAGAVVLILFLWIDSRDKRIW